LMSGLSHPQIAAEAGQAVHNALMTSVLRVRDSRGERLALSNDRTNDIKWATVLILGVITQIAIGLVHLERPRAHLAAIVVFSSAAIVALGLIAMQEHPFEGSIRVSPARLEEVLAQMAG